MPQDVDVSKMPLPGGNTNAPASGTYGEGAALDRLKAQLPDVSSGPGAEQSPGVSPMPTPPSGAGISTAPSAGVPSALLAPTTRPGEPVSTPLGAGPVSPLAGAQNGRQQRLAIVDALLNDPNVSDETREFADLVRRRLLANQGA